MSDETAPTGEAEESVPATEVSSRKGQTSVPMEDPPTPAENTPEAPAASIEGASVKHEEGTSTETTSKPEAPSPVPAVSLKSAEKLMNPPRTPTPTGEKSVPSLSQDSPYWKPIQNGWIREVVYRNSVGNNGKKADAYYKSPLGKKYRSLREIERAIDEGKGGFDGLRVENFTFFQQPLGINDPSKEVIRGSDPARRISSVKRTSDGSNLESPPAKAPKKSPKKPAIKPLPSSPIPMSSKVQVISGQVRYPHQSTPGGLSGARPTLLRQQTAVRSQFRPQTAVRSQRPTTVIGMGQTIRPLMMNSAYRMPVKTIQKGPKMSGKAAERIVCEPSIYESKKKEESDLPPEAEVITEEETDLCTELMESDGIEKGEGCDDGMSTEFEEIRGNCNGKVVIYEENGEEIETWANGISNIKGSDASKHESGAEDEGSNACNYQPSADDEGSNASNHESGADVNGSNASNHESGADVNGSNACNYEPGAEDEGSNASNYELGSDVEKDSTQPEPSEPDSTSQCNCGMCVVPVTEEKIICCNVVDHLAKVKEPHGCITFHPSFTKLILDTDVLDLTRHQLSLKTRNVNKKKYLNAESPMNITWRYIAYKQFIAWANLSLQVGKQTKVAIPSCVVQAVRVRFPERNSNRVLNFS